MITINIHTILTIKKIIGLGDFALKISKGSTLKDLFLLMIEKWGEPLSPYLLSPDGNGKTPQQRITRIMVNGQDIAFLDGMETVLQESDDVHILPIIAGG